MARSRKSAASEQQNPLSSAQDGPRGTRRKRRTSADSVIEDDRSQRESTQLSDVREESHPASDTEPRPRKKRVKRVFNTDEDQLAQELQHSLDHPASSLPPDPETISVAPHPQTQPQQPHRRVRFSDPGPPIPAGTPTHRSTTGGPLTPTVRPSAKINRRISLPATFGTASPDGGEIQFTPLRAVLEDRKRRRLRRWGLSEEMNSIDEHKREDARAKRELQRLRHELQEKDKRVTELMYELEVQRQFAIEVQDADREKEDEKVRALEDQLENLRKEITEQKERHEHELATIEEDPNEDVDMDDGMGAPASDDEDNAGFMLIQPEDINLQEELSQLPDDDNTSNVSNMDGVAEGTQTDGPTDVPDPSHEVQIQQFENAIAELSKEASEAKAALQILSIELQTLGFTEPEANAYDVLTSLRSAFQHVRNEVEAICPGDSSTQLENGALIYSLVEKLRSLREEINEKMQDAKKQSEMNALLNSQNKGLVDKMAEFENRRQTLEGQWHELDVVSEKKTKEIIELEEELEAYKAAVDERDAEIVDQDQKMDEMEVELAEREQANERLQAEINSSREEVASLQELIGRVEEESRTSLEKLKQEHAAAIAELEEKLSTEQLHREQAEQEIDEKTSFITQLEVKIEAAETDLDKLRDNLAELQELRENEKTQREAAEEELDHKNETITDLEHKVEASENELDELRGELENLRNLAETEREQLENALSEVEEKDDKIAELEQKIHDAGLQANDLRQKLFELQVQKQAVIEELQDTAAKREEQYNQDIAAEIARREDAEQLAADRTAEITELQAKLNNIEEDIEVMTIEKDDLITELEKRVDKLEEDLIQLRNEYNDLAEQKAEEIQVLHDDIAILNTDINEKAQLIEKLRAEAAEKEEAHKREVEEKEARIAQLSEEMDTARTDIQHLEATRNSLEHRIEDAAVQMLEMQNDQANEIDSLRNKIENNEAEIDRLRRALELREDKYTSDINNKNEQLESLQLVADARLTTITALENQVDSLKKKFRDHALSSRKTMATIAQSFINAAENAQDLSDRHGENSEAAIREVEDMKPEGMNYSFTSERVNVLKQGGVARKGRRQFDSGIGVADDDEDMLEETMA